MARTRSPLLVLFLTVFIDMVGFGIIIPVLPLYAEGFHASPVAIGWLTGIYSGMQIIFTPVLGKLSDRFGRRPVLMLSLAGTALGFVLMGLAHSLLLLFVARIISGITGGNISIPQAYIADVTTPETRSKWMGMIGAAFGLGFTFGPMLGGVMSRVSYSAPFFVAALLAAGNVILLYFILTESLPKEHRAKAHEDASLFEVFRHGTGWLFGTVVATYFFLVAGFTHHDDVLRALHGASLRLRRARERLPFGFIGIVTVIVQGGLIGRLVRIFGERALARAGLFVTALSLALLPVCSNLTWLLVACLGLSLGSGFASPPLNGLASQLVDQSWQGRALGVLQSAGGTARLLGPLLGGWLLMFDLHKPLSQYGRTPFFAASLLCGIGGVLAFCLQKPAADRAPENIPVGSAI